MRTVKSLILLAFLLWLTSVEAYEIGQTIFYCNFDTGSVESGIIKTFQTLPVLDTKPVIVLENNLAIPERDIIEYPVMGTKCI